jgi:Arc/MetJ family transcription regulator
VTDTAIKKDFEPEIDEELLTEAQRQLGLSSRNEAINAGLLRVVTEERARRRQALERLQRMSDEGLFDYSALDEADR